MYKSIRNNSPEKGCRQKLAEQPTYRTENVYNPEATPQYFQNFVFDMYASISEIRQSSLWLAVMEPRCCAPPRLLGEATIDLANIWSQKRMKLILLPMRLNKLK
ncbi:unnamed protein product, partial [Iphiclides podalirius]